MISPHIREAIVALLAVDTSATDAEREAVAAALQGEPQGPQVLAVAEVAKRLGRTRQTIYNLVKRGLLSPVRTSGGILSGITRESLDRFLRSA